jgi:hypothetical protein
MSRADQWLIVGLFLAVAAVSPWFPGIKSSNEIGRVYLAEALIVDGTVAIDGPITRWHDIGDKAVRAGQTYCDKAPGVSWLAVPAVAAYRALVDTPTLAGEVRAARLLGSLLPTAFLLWGVLGWLRSRVSASTARAVVIAYALGSLSTTYGVLLFGHQLAAAAVFWAFLLAREARPDSSRRRLFGVGALAAIAVLAAYPAVLPLIPIGVLFLVRVRARPRALAWATLGAVPLVGALMAYHTVAFGGPMTTGYAWLTNPFFTRMHRQGFMGLGVPKLGKVWFHFFSPRKGFFFFAPWLLLAVPGWWHLRGKEARGAGGAVDGRMVASVSLVYVLFMLSLAYGNGGWTLSQRHLVGWTPWLTLPVAMWVDRGPNQRAVFGAAALVALMLTGLGTAIFPYYPVPLHNPSFQLAWPLATAGFAAASVYALLGIPTLLGSGLVGVSATWAWLRPVGARRAALAVLAAAGWLLLASRYASTQDTARVYSVVEAAYDRTEAQTLRP